MAGQSVLFIGIGFYDYEAAIADELRRRGATVHLYNELPDSVLKGMLSPLLRRLKVDASQRIRTHHERILAETADQQISQVFVIKGEWLEPWFLEALRARHPAAEFIAYHWDSLTRSPKLVELRAHFDRAYTFDPEDARRLPAFRFRPLFFRNAMTAAEGTIPRYDLSFVGWMHHTRLRQVQTLAEAAERRGLSVFFYLYTGLFSYVALLLKGAARFVHARTLKYDDYAAVAAASSVIVDLPHPLQTGLTMRAIETVGAGKKMITTARDIAQYDFFRPENIFVIDDDHPHIDAEFLALAPVPVDARIIARYSLQSWVDEVFGLASTEPAARER